MVYKYIQLLILIKNIMTKKPEFYIRLEKEITDLNDKYEKLRLFLAENHVNLGTPHSKVSDEQYGLLVIQASTMQSYVRILEERKRGLKKELKING